MPSTPPVPPHSEPKTAKPILAPEDGLMPGESSPPASPMAPLKAYFWRGKTLEQLEEAEWEALCDGCGRCCLHKLEDEDTGQVCYTNVACRLLELNSCRCSKYKDRHAEVAACIPLPRQNIKDMAYMPPSCAYRLVAEGKPLPDWHPLLSGDSQSVHRAGISVQGTAISERDFQGDLEDQVIEGFI